MLFNVVEYLGHCVIDILIQGIEDGSIFSSYFLPSIFELFYDLPMPTFVGPNTVSAFSSEVPVFK